MRMILVADMGNSNIVIGIYEDDRLIKNIRTMTNRNATSDEYFSTIRQLLLHNHVDVSKIDGSIISSVVPQLTHALQEAFVNLFGVEPKVVGPGMKTGIKIVTDNPAEVGADLVTGIVAAIKKYPQPLVVVDVGTATKFCVAKNDAFIGCIIYPGVKVASDALSKIASQLPYISLERPEKVIGTNTIKCMQSGVIYGNASVIDGLVERIEEELNEEVSVILTGGYTKVLAPACKTKLIIDEDLLLDGLYELYKKNI